MGLRDKLASMFGGDAETAKVEYQCRNCFHKFEAVPDEDRQCEACASDDLEVLESGTGGDAAAAGMD